MKIALRTLAFSSALLLTAACHKKTGEAPGPADAAAGTSSQALQAADAGVAVDASVAADAGVAAAVPGSPEAREACLDSWLQARKLDSYGSPAGTMYAGGTPLFDERTGEQRDRFEYVAARHPAVRAACGGGGATGAPAPADAGTR